MENKEDNIEDLFRERFENDEVTVSPKVWENIKETLPRDKDSIGFAFSLNTTLWSIAGIFVLSAVIGSYIYFYHNKITHHITSTTLPDSIGNRSTSLGSTDEPSSAGRHQAGIQQAAHQSTIVLHSESSSSYNSSKESIRSKVSANSFYKKETYNRPTQIIVSSSNRHHESTQQQKIKHKPIDNLTNEAILNKQKTFFLLPSKQHTFVYDDTETRKKDQTQRSATWLEETEEKIASSNTKNKFVTAQDSIQAKSKNVEIKGANNFSSQRDSSSLQFNTAFIGSPHAFVIDSVSVQTSFAQDSLNKNKTEARAQNKMNKDSALIPPDSLSSGKGYDALTSNTVLYPSALKDSTLMKQTLSSEDSVSQDSLVKTKTPLFVFQDSSLTKRDSLQYVLPDSASAKTTGKKEKDKSKLWSRLSFDLLATALLTGASTSTRATDSIVPSAIEDKNRNDKNSLGYSAGIMVNYTFSDRIIASAGIGYTFFTEQYHFNYTLKQNNWVFIDTSWQLMEYDSIHRDFTVKDQYSFLSIPLQLSYTFLQKGKLKLSVAVGLRSNILLKGITYIANAQKNDVVKETSRFNKISFMYQLSLEAAYKWNEQIAVLVQPLFLYGATSIHSQASSLQQKPYGAGMTVGLRFTF